MLRGDLTSGAIFNSGCLARSTGGQDLSSSPGGLLPGARARSSSRILGGPELFFRSWTTLERGVQLVREPGVFTWTYGEPPSASSPSSGCTNGARDLQGTPAAPADGHAP